MAILVTGATGNVGAEVVKGLQEHSVQVRAGMRDPAKSPFGPNVEARALDFEKPATWPGALTDVDRIFLVRPPQISDVTKTIGPFLKETKSRGIRQVVFLSLLGVEKNPVVPHRAIEEKIRELSFDFTMLRASFFMQNLDTTHRAELRDRSELFVPAGQGRTSFVDVRDLAAVGVNALRGELPPNQAYPLTGAEALTYTEVAALLSIELGRPIRYANPGMLKFTLQKRREGLPWAFTLVMLGLYTTCKLGLAAKITPDLERLLGRPPISMRQYLHQYREAWM